MQTPVKFEREARTIPFMGKTIEVVNLTPILTPKERERRRREIEKMLYGIFVKYA